jgi:hypothetical protein
VSSSLLQDCWRSGRLVTDGQSAPYRIDDAAALLVADLRFFVKESEDG